MSGYASKAEAMSVLRETITSDHNRTGLSKDPSDYYMGRLFDATYYHRGRGYGWGASTDPAVIDDYAAVLRAHLRGRAKK